ncbi:MAG: sigma-70 family RNA polymerase sigma factor [Bacteroidia bacterium]|nr:sigma-70 family RNA polymerase sigma factor [Bacteroidia bacterium]
MKNTDENILALLADDRTFDQGFRMLVKTYQERLYWTIRRIVHFHEDADDVIQNTFIKVFKNIKGFEGASKLYTWMYRIACNEAISHLNRNKNRKLINNEDQMLFLENNLKADIYFNSERAQLTLAKAIDSLPEKQRLVFNLRYFEALSYKDISETLETSVGALKASFHHAVKKIETYLKENYDIVNG